MTKRLRLTDAIESANQKNGLCLSKTFINVHKEMSWQCECGHIWQVPYKRIRQGKWCPKCAGKHISIENCRKAAEDKGGVCQSDKYVDGNTKLKWRCGDGHEWDAVPRHVLRGDVWCPICVGKVYNEDDIAIKLNKMRQLAVDRGGNLLTSNYRTARTKMKWCCSIGHTFSASWNNVSRGTWCPICNVHFGERFVRLTLESIFSGHSFPSVRPDFLRGKNNRNLELDGYCSDLKLAFEFDGRQHFQETAYSLGGQLSEIIKRDRFKDIVLKRCGITLIRFRYDDDLNHISDLIMSRIPPDRNDLLSYNFCVNPDYNVAYKTENKLHRFKEIAESKGGKCLSEHFINYENNLEFECEKGHRWFTNPSNILKGKWCRKCSHKDRVKNRADFIAWEKVVQIREMYAMGNYTYTALGEIFGVSRVTISNIINMRTRISL